MHLTNRLLIMSAGYALIALFRLVTFPPDVDRERRMEPVHSWWFVPMGELSGGAEEMNPNGGPRPNGIPMVDMPTLPLRFHGQQPTERRLDLLSESDTGEEGLPSAMIANTPFSVEMLAVYHVDQPVGAMTGVRGERPSDPIPWLLSVHDWEATLRVEQENGTPFYLRHRLEEWTGYKERWLHIVATIDRQQTLLYVNGKCVARHALGVNTLAWPEEQPSFEAAAYMEREPYMQLGDLLRHLALWDRVLDEESIQQRWLQFQQQIEQGRIWPGRFHFTAPPYLNVASRDQVNLLWETDRPSTAKVWWGKDNSLNNSEVFGESGRLHEMTISGLEPNTTYFYRVVCEADAHEPLDSGLLSFRTGVSTDQPFRFAILGDTESRPHINRRLAAQIWGHRPHFVVNLGDLTDAGMEPHRYEWTCEYFLGMGRLHGRVPVFPVPGNGEGDLYWYRHYHRLPEPEDHYDFVYGDVHFFMLDSNRRAAEFAPGGRQFVWLAEKLAESTAKWKIVCHHHATYTSEEDDYGDSWQGPTTFGDLQVRPLVPLCESHGVDLMMFGHLHLYERSFPVRDGAIDHESGVVHLLAGGGGGNLEDFAPTPAWFSAHVYRGHHYLICENDGQSLTFRMYDVDGRLKDQWGLGPKLSVVSDD